ncbi:MAG: hypothetical protein FJ260_04055 [Planctomycetes bacterium]|nr:hypothetical protein [Planctomycetota bacterium]
MTGTVRARTGAGPACVRAVRGAVVACLLVPFGCAEERVEYRYRPSFMTDPSAPKEVTLADGTRVVFVDEPLGQPKPSAEAAAPVLGPDGKPVPRKVFQPREELDDGTVILRNLMPADVVANAMACFRNEEYRLMWDQLLAPESRDAYERTGGFQAFEQWCRTNRKPTMELLNRMRFNAVGSDVAMKEVRPGVMRATLAPHLWEQFNLRVVEFEQTKDGMKLLTIR